MARTPEQQAAADARAAQAAERAAEAALPILERIQKYKTKILELQTKEGELTAAESDELYKQEMLLAKNLAIQEKRAKKALGTYQVELELANVYASQASDLSSISRVYKGLTDVQQQSLKTVQSSLSAVQSSLLADENKKALLDSTLTGITELQGLQQKMAETGPEDVETQKSISTAYNAQLNKLKEAITLKESISEITEEEAKALVASLDTQVDSLTTAQKYGTINAETKEIIEGQIQAYEGIKKSIRGVIGTANLLFSGWQGFARITLMGAGQAIAKLGKTTREFGGFLGAASVSATVLGTVFDDAGDVAKGLAEELGGMEKATFGAQLNTNLMAINMGISGTEAAKLTGAFARMNGGSVETAQNLAAGTKEMAKTAGVVPSKVMADLAGSAEEFALYGKDGGKNLAQAAVQAAKMGVSLKTMTGVADNLLDFENSINSELELGAMLGKNINLDRARALAYEGDIAGATQETLNALGGVDAFNKMDYFQKKKTAELMGVSVEELQKMVTAQTEAATIGGQINGAFNTVSEGLTAITTGPLGNFVTGLSGAIGTTKEIAGNFKEAGGFLSGMGEKLKGMFGGKKPNVPDIKPDSISDSVNKTESAGSKVAKGKKSDSGLKSLADGLKAMGNTKVLFGALNLLPTALGLVAMVAGIPALLAVSALGVPAGLGLKALGKGLEAFGKGGVAALKGIAILALFGVALIPLTYALSLLAPLVESIGKGIGSMIESIGNGIASIVTSISELLVNVLPLLNLEAAIGILAMAAAFTTLAGSLALLSTLGLAAIPVLIAVGVVGGVAGGLMGGGGEAGGEGNTDRTGELIDEIKGLRADLIAGKIAVNIDGQKVTSNVGKVVSRISSNSYAKV
jgi:hypothetical protein